MRRDLLWGWSSLSNTYSTVRCLIDYEKVWIKFYKIINRHGHMAVGIIDSRLLAPPPRLFPPLYEDGQRLPEEEARNDRKSSGVDAVAHVSWTRPRYPLITVPSTRCCNEGVVEDHCSSKGRVSFDPSSGLQCRYRCACRGKFLRQRWPSYSTGKKPLDFLEIFRKSRSLKVMPFPFFRTDMCFTGIEEREGELKCCKLIELSAGKSSR